MLCSIVVGAALAHGADLHTMQSLPEIPSATTLGLRGTVKQVVEETTYPSSDDAGRTFTSTWTFAADGRLLQSQFQSFGPRVTTNYSYDARGRLAKVSWSTDGQHDAEELATTYAYDDKGRITSVSGAGERELSYEYDGEGRKHRIQHYPVFQREPNVGVGAVQWENSELAIPPPSGGTVTTIYDEHDRPAEAEVRDDGGQVTMRIDRKYDERGRILGDKVVAEQLESTLPPDALAEMNEAQRKAIEKFLTRALIQQESAYKYDPQGRRIEKHLKGGIFGDEVTTTRYNEQGDVTEEDSARIPSPEMSTEFQMDDAGNMIPGKKLDGAIPSRMHHRYAYQYDAQGNWTEKTELQRAEPESEFRAVISVQRTLTYY
jgi:YD repeat-containing protein